MRLLFIYFYKDKGPFKKGTTIRFSKKYIVDDINCSDDDFEFNISLSKNPLFQDNFYAKNTDLGVLIGENGTGKSILINSIRDNKNDYSICIYEENEEFIILENDLFKLQKYKEFDKKNIPYDYETNISVKINDVKLKQKRKFKSIYYSSILESINKNFNDDFDISNTKLLNEISEDNLNKKIEQLEINDLQKMNDFNYPIKVDISPTFFDDAKNFIKSSYICLFEKTMALLRENKNDEKIAEIFNKLPEFILNDIANYHLEENQIFIEEISSNPNIVNKYLNLYKKDIFEYLTNNNIDYKEESLKMDKKINLNKDKLINDDLLNQLSKIGLDSKIKNIKDMVEDIRKLFHIKYTPYTTTNSKKNTNIRLQYLYLEKVFDLCLVELKEKNTNLIMEQLNIYKVYYLRQQIGYTHFILFDLFKKGKFTDILLLDKKHSSFHLKKGNEKIINNREKTVDSIKQIIEDNSSLFYDVVKNDLKNLDDGLLKLIFIKKMELTYIKNDSNKGLLIYLTKLLKSNYIEDYEKEYFSKQFKEKRDFEFESAVLFNKKLKEDKPLFENNKINLHTYNEFVKDAVHPFSFTFDPPVSSGQRAKELISARINDAIQKINKGKENQNILLLLDEADLKLHLEWQRKFVNDLIKFLNTYSDNKFYILYATHSPMILSDIIDDRVIFLKKENEFSIDVSQNKDKKRTFGANIYDLYHDSFFMDQFMGEFAQNKINEIIDIINLHKILNKIDKTEKTLKDFENRYDLVKIFNSYYKRYNVKNIIDKDSWEKESIQIEANLKITEFISTIENDKAYLNNTIGSIGEPILRNQLLDDIKNIGTVSNIDDIVHKIKNLSHEKIEQELLKYDREKQIEIWKKLFQSKDIK